ncbi:MAG TPA: glycosyl transferase, partial [Microbacterium sp.]|nr:glycosyl transferase [Microbacterium sp.]
PVTEPIDLATEQGDKGVISAAPTRRQLSGGKRALVVAPAVAVSALLFTGCTADAWPDLAGSPTPSASASVVVPEDQGSPVVTEAQAERIVGRIAAQVADADEAMDATAAAERLDGAALATRETNYRLRAALPDQAAPAAIPTGKLKVTLPEANDAWPRTFLAVAAGTGDTADVVMSVTQQDAWSPYKLTYVADLVTDPDLKLAPPYVGAIPIPGDSPFLTLAPDDLAAAYADVLTNGTDSEFASLFDVDDDAFLTVIDADRAKRLEEFNQTGAETGTLAFSADAGTTAPIALATLDSGAIVAVTVYDHDTVTPTNADAVIKVDSNPTVQTLAGTSQSTTGFTTSYANQLFFFVPSESSHERIRLLGFMSDILDAKAVS